MGSIKRQVLLLFLCMLFVSGCENDPSPEMQFDSFEEELEYLIEQYVRMGASVGIIDQQQNTQEFRLYRNTLEHSMYYRHHQHQTIKFHLLD